MRKLSCYVEICIFFFGRKYALFVTTAADFLCQLMTVEERQRREKRESVKPPFHRE